MKKLFPIIALFLASTAHAQLWSGVLAPARAMDWTGAGVTGGIPTGYTKCGATIAAYTGTAATINTQAAGCSANQYVLLGPGTFSLSTGIDLKGDNNGIILRGSGADQTFITFTGTDLLCTVGITRCLIRAESTDGTYPHAGMPKIAWTAGYAVGTTSITLADGSSLGVGYTLVLDQCDPPLTGSSCTGNVVDNGQFLNCGQQYDSISIPGSPFGCAHDGPDGQSVLNRNTVQYVEVVSCSPACGTAGVTTVTISPGLVHPNWNSSQTPQAYAIRPMKNVGFENFSVDSSGVPGTAEIFGLANLSYSWVTGVAMLNGKQSGICSFYGNHMEFRDNYIYNIGRSGAYVDPYGIRYNGGNYLIQNNIIQKTRIGILAEGPSVGRVVGYNFTVNNYNPNDTMFHGMEPHSAGNNFGLDEGNVGTDWELDNSHGTQMMNTLYRNFLTAWESCGNGQCGANTFKDFFANAINAPAMQRYQNIVGNVMGTTGIQNAYDTSGSAYYRIYAVGTSMSGVKGTIPADTLAMTSLLRWANVDSVTGFATPRYCGSATGGFGGIPNTGWSTTCASTSEVPTTDPNFPVSIPTKGDTVSGQPAMPASFYLAAKPAWFGTRAWPAIGPDVTGGNVGQCTGVKNVVGRFDLLPAATNLQCLNFGITASAWGGHVNMIPAMDVYLNTMGGNPDGTNGPLTFNANYYVTTAPTVTLTWNNTPNSFPMNFGSHVNGVASGALIATLTNTGTATLTYSLISVTGTNSADFVVTPGVTNPCVILGSTLAPGVSCTANLVFTPSVCGSGYPCAKTANLRVDSNASSTPDLGVLNGTSTATPTGSGAVQPTLMGMVWNNDKFSFYRCASCGLLCYTCPLPTGSKVPKITFH